VATDKRERVGQSGLDNSVGELGSLPHVTLAPHALREGSSRGQRYQPPEIVVPPPYNVAGLHRPNDPLASHVYLWRDHRRWPQVPSRHLDSPSNVGACYAAMFGACHVATHLLEYVAKAVKFVLAQDLLRCAYQGYAM
jgi:hypothetical protein